jgi:hypothetical protein
MDFKYKVFNFEPQNGVAYVWVYNADHPQGEKISVALMNPDGTLPTTSAQVRAIIEAAIPVAWFETIKARALANPDITPITNLLGKEYTTARTAQEQGVLKEVVDDPILDQVL